MTILTRRSMLAGLGCGGAGMLIPLLQAGRAQAAPFPRRLVIVMTTNGVLQDNFWPKSAVSETQFTFNEGLKPLEGLREKLLLLRGLAMSAAIDDASAGKGATGHHNLYALLTGKRGADGTIYGNQPFPTADTASIDQVIANGPAGQGVPFKSLELGVYPAADNGDAISFRGPALGSGTNHTAQSNAPEYDPVKVYNRVFSSFAAGTAPPPVPTVDKLAIERKSILDHVGADLTRFSASLGTADRLKVQAHAESIRAIEKNLATLGAPSPAAVAACTRPAKPAALNIKELKNYPVMMQTQMDLIVASLACDMTRVVTFMMTNRDDGYLTFPWLAGVTRNHHELAHDAPKAADIARQKNIVDQWYASQFAYLIGKMNAVPEGDGTLLDNSAVLFMNHMEDGAAHNFTSMPWVLAGSCGGQFRTGRYLRFGSGKSVPHNGLLVSLCNAMGVPVTSFGDPKYGGALAGLT